MHAYVCVCVLFILMTHIINSKKLSKLKNYTNEINLKSLYPFAHTFHICVRKSIILSNTFFNSLNFSPTHIP
jgi:hypothetical protein